MRDVFDALTAGRSAGLYGRLARTVANASSFSEMVEISRSPPDQLLQRSEREKFARLSGSALPAAERIACFALAFGRSEAEDVFQDVNVGLAIQELLDVGLLRDTGDDGFEMHETVRAGIEGAISRVTRREAHAALARHYGQTGRLSAEVFHLEKAGDGLQAGDRARGAFLKGKNWSQLYNYITAQELVTADEVIDVISSTRAVDGIYLLPEVLSLLGTQRHAERLLEVIRTQIERSVRNSTGRSRWRELSFLCHQNVDRSYITCRFSQLAAMSSDGMRLALLLSQPGDVGHTSPAIWSDYLTAFRRQ